MELKLVVDDYSSGQFLSSEQGVEKSSLFHSTGSETPGYQIFTECHVVCHSKVKLSTDFWMCDLFRTIFKKIMIGGDDRISLVLG